MKISRTKLKQIIKEELGKLGKHPFPKLAVNPDPEKAKEEDTELEKALSVRINAHFRKNYPFRKAAAEQMADLMSDYPEVFKRYEGEDVYRGMHTNIVMTKKVLIDNWNRLTPLQRSRGEEDGGPAEGDVVASSWTKSLYVSKCFVDKATKSEEYGYILVANTTNNYFIDEEPLTKFKFASYSAGTPVTVEPTRTPPEAPIGIGANDRWAPQGCDENQEEAVGIGPIEMIKVFITKVPASATMGDLAELKGDREYIEFTKEVQQLVANREQQEEPMSERHNITKISKNRLKQIIKEELDSVDEGVESITPENIQLALQALKQIGINFAPAVAGATVWAVYELLKDKLSKPDAEDE